METKRDAEESATRWVGRGDEDRVVELLLKPRAETSGCK